MSYEQLTALTIDNETISLSEVLRLAKWQRELGFLRQAADAHLIRRAATERGISVSNAELQQAANDFRQSRDLLDAASTKKWLASNHLSVGDWESCLEGEIIERKLRDALTGSEVEQHFAENRLSFESATISRLVVAAEDIARELRLQIAEDEADFHQLAREHSIETATKLAGGYAGIVRRADLEAAIEAAVFGAQPGRVVGPFKIDAGWSLVKIESRHPAMLDDATRANIKSQLFKEWLDERRRKAKIAMPLLVQLNDE